jgi:hypothetical protein
MKHRKISVKVGVLLTDIRVRVLGEESESLNKLATTSGVK